MKPKDKYHKDGKVYTVDQVIDDTIYFKDQCGKSNHLPVNQFISTYSKLPFHA